MKAEWLIALSDAFSLEQAMAIGTAGYTAALCVNALEHWGISTTAGKPVLVTGAACGVGAVAISLLAKKGYTITASTGRAETHEYIPRLGASAFIDRATLTETGGSMQKELWAGAVDSVGSTTLANVLFEKTDGAL